VTYLFNLRPETQTDVACARTSGGSTGRHEGDVREGDVMAVILVVDDDPDTCESLVLFLQKSNHEATCAADGREAMAQLTKRRPDLVLLDLRLPEMDGVSFLNVVRSYLQWIELPIIVITGIDDELTIKSVLEAGVKHVFRKGSLEFSELLKAINSELVTNGS